jgi:DNA (cytosine-5)-methyltransferase 1
MTPRRVLDLFCGAGGAAMGLHRAWPDAEIVGVDIKPQPRYPFTFVQTDAMTYPLDGFDFIWASPPCQHYSCVTKKCDRERHPDLITLVRGKLSLSGFAYVIENVVGARREMLFPTLLCGSMFGLRTQRHRLFEANFALWAPQRCDHQIPPLLVTTAGANSRKNGNYKSVKNAREAYGIDWMDGNGLAEAIPPAYSEYIARQLPA